MRTAVVLTLLLGVVFSYCPSHVESRLDQVITKLEMMINALENEDFSAISFDGDDSQDGTEEPPTPDTSEGDSRTNFLFCVPIRLQNSCPAGYVARSGSRDSNGRRSFMCCK